MQPTTRPPLPSFGTTRDDRPMRPRPIPRAAAALLAVAAVAALAGCADGSAGGARRADDLDRPATSTAALPDAAGTDPAEPVALPPAVDPLPTPTAGNAPGTVPATTADPTAPATVDTISFTPLVVTDPMLSGKAAFSVLVPEGWQASGEVQWLPYWSRQAFLQTRVLDPVTGLTIYWLPIQDFMYFTPPAGFSVPIGGNYQGKAYVPPVYDPVQFVREFWMGDSLSHLQDATVVFVEDLPAVAQQFLIGFGGPADAGAWRIRYEYTYQGVVWEQDVSFALLWSGSDPVNWYVNFASTAGAPKGELDRQAPLVSTVLASRISTVEWEGDYRLVQQLFYRGLQQQIADTQRLVELRAQYRAESQALQQQVFDERQASIDARNEVFRETLGGVQGYDDPVNGGVVQLPLGWDTYWVNEQGEYIAVSDPNFDPNTMNDGVWTPLQPHA